MGVHYFTKQQALITFIGTAVLGPTALRWRREPLRFGLAVAAMLAAPVIWRLLDPALLEQSRSFFGVYTLRKDETERFHVMRHGTTIHGTQFIDPARRREPLAYYGRPGPVGQFFASLDAAPLREVGVVGLGTGTLACYRRGGEHWSFFEIDAQVIEMAQSGRHFAFVKSCAPEPRMVLGDARLSLAAEPAGRYDLLILDAFSSDAIPVHLLTREALAIYLDRLSATGSLLIHVSNRHLDLEPLIAGLGAEVGLKVLMQPWSPSAAEAREGHLGSIWMAMSRDPDLLARLSRDRHWQQAPRDPRLALWSDSYSNLLQVLRD
jgi:hypothetical protein